MRDDAFLKSLDLFRLVVDSVGIKRFSSDMDLSTRQINRILSGVQPNPIDRLLRSLQACKPEVGDRILDYVCSEMGGYFVREEGSLDASATRAVKEAAEAIAAISDGHISPIDAQQVREAISSLVALLRVVQGQGYASQAGSESLDARSPHPDIKVASRPHGHFPGTADAYLPRSPDG
ncbi:MAG: hypothetical protein IBJ11_05140 [Phycisphaerales bacterium]|nr:hypothetical protein [Phycisphaerales bacterium]